MRKTGRFLVSVALLAGGLSLAASRPLQPAGTFDLVLAGGRVMDPASGLDAVRHVGIRGVGDCGDQHDAAHRQDHD